MAKRISFDDRLGWARTEIDSAAQKVITRGQRLEVIGMRRVLRVFEGESDEAIKAHKEVLRDHREHLKRDGGGGSD